MGTKLGMGMLHTMLHTALAHSGKLTIHRSSGGAGIVHKVSLSFIASVALPPPPRRLDQRYETEPGRPGERAQISQNHWPPISTDTSGHAAFEPTSVWGLGHCHQFVVNDLGTRIPH